MDGRYVETATKYKYKKESYGTQKTRNKNLSYKCFEKVEDDAVVSRDQIVATPL